MSDYLQRLKVAIDQAEAEAHAGTPTPWEPGHIWGRAGVINQENPHIPIGSCAYCHHGPPAIIDPSMDINGKRMPGHIHRYADDVYDPEHSISGADGTLVLQGAGDYDDYHLSPADAALIIAAVNARLRNIAEDRAVLQRHRPMLVSVRGIESTLCAHCAWEENYPGEYREYPCEEATGVGRRYGITPEEA